MRFSKPIIVAIIAMVAIFTTAVLYVFLQVGSEPAVLIGSFFAFCTGELWALASIKKAETKEKEGEKND